MGCIYKITNTVNGKAYIGQTIRDAKKTRIRNHLAGNGSQLVKKAVEKYGKDAFTFEILHDGIIPELLDSYEIEEIVKHNCVSPNGYNLETGGRNGSPSEETRQKTSDGHKGKTLSEKHRRRISEANKGKVVSEQTRRKISEANKGRKWPMESRRRISEARKGKTHSEQTRQKMSEARKGRVVSEQTRRKRSEAQETPERIAARQFFFSLSPDMDLKEKRKHLRQRFPHRSPQAIHNWCRRFDLEETP